MPILKAKVDLKKVNLFNLSNINSGVYFVKLINPGSFKIKKIIINK